MPFPVNTADEIDIRIAELEAKYDAQIATLEGRLNDQEEELVNQGARITALEQAQGTPPDTEEPPDPIDPISGPMVATITATATPYHAAGPFIFHEEDGDDLGDYVDPTERFVVGCRRVRADGCDLVVDFLRYTGPDTSAACVVMQRGTVDAMNLNAYNRVQRGARFGGYSIEVTGDYEMRGETHEHYDGSEWRVRSWGAADNWPFELTPIETLQAQGIVGIYDQELGAVGCNDALEGMRYEPMKATNGKGPTPGFCCALRLLGGSTGVDSAIGLEGDEISTWLAGKENLRGTAFEQAEAYHIYPWTRLDPATGAPIRICGEGDLFAQGQINNGGSRPISCLHATQTQATITGPVGTAVPSATQVIDCNGIAFRILNPLGAAGIPSSGTSGHNIEGVTGSPYLPLDGTATLSPPVEGCSVVISLNAPNMCEGIDGISLDANHTPNGGFLIFMLTGDPYHLRAVQSKAHWQRSASPWAVGNTGVEWCTKNGFNIMSARSQAWFCRDIAEAVIATPEAVPSWLNRREDFAYTLGEIKSAYEYRWANPPNSGGPVTNIIDVMAGQNTVGSYYADYVNLAMVRVLVADPSWSSWVDKHIRNLIDRFDPASGWCNNIATFYAGIDMRNCKNWPEVFNVLLAHPSYANPQPSGVSGLTGCPDALVVHPDGTNWNTFNTLLWPYAAMCRLRQIGYGGDAFDMAYEVLVPRMRDEIRSGKFGKIDWRFCFR